MILLLLISGIVKLTPGTGLGFLLKLFSQNPIAGCGEPLFHTTYNIARYTGQNSQTFPMICECLRRIQKCQLLTIFFTLAFVHGCLPARPMAFILCTDMTCSSSVVHQV